jgi:hypothetical protein
MFWERQLHFVGYYKLPYYSHIRIDLEASQKKREGRSELCPEGVSEQVSEANEQSYHSHQGGIGLHDCTYRVPNRSMVLPVTHSCPSDALIYLSLTY